MLIDSNCRIPRQWIIGELCIGCDSLTAQRTARAAAGVL